MPYDAADTIPAACRVAIEYLKNELPHRWAICEREFPHKVVLRGRDNIKAGAF